MSAAPRQAVIRDGFTAVLVRWMACALGMLVVVGCVQVALAPVAAASAPRVSAEPTPGANVTCTAPAVLVSLVLVGADPATSEVTVRSAVIWVDANTYPYVNGNPINAWDPSGHWGTCWKFWSDCGGKKPAPKADAKKADTKASPYTVHISKDGDGNRHVALVQNQHYVKENGWKEGRPEIIGTVCQAHVVHTYVRQTVDWGSSCASAGPAELRKALVHVEREKGLSDELAKAATAIAGLAAYNETSFEVAAKFAESSAVRTKLKNAATSFKSVGRALSALDVALVSYKNISNEQLTEPEKAFNIGGHTLFALGGALVAGLACPETGGAGCLAAAGFLGGTAGSETFDRTLEKEGSPVATYQPPTAPCSPMVQADGREPWNRSADTVYCRRY